jgi:cbb3-type cytochrome oxidase maturation protein
MEIMVVLIPLALLLGLLFIGAFIWMTWNGQYDDLDSPQLRMLLDEQKRSTALKGNENVTDK